MNNARKSALNTLLLLSLLVPALSSCGGGVGGGSVTPPVPPAPVSAEGPVVVAPPVTVPGDLPAVVMTIDRPSIQLVEKANVPPQTFILSINRTTDQVKGMFLGNANTLGAGAPSLGPSGAPVIKNGVTSWYMSVDAQGAVQGDYTFRLNVRNAPGDVIGSIDLQVKVNHDQWLEADPTTWAAYERQVFALVNEVRTQGTLNGDAGVITGTCAAGVPHLGALLPSSVGYLAARGHAGWLSSYGYTAHTEPDLSFTTFYGKEMMDRYIRADRVIGSAVSPSAVGENAAAGQTSPMEVMTQWLRSPGHCANIMNPDYTHLAAGYGSALAYKVGPNATVYKDSWVQVFVRY